jgi:hypothetical protein
VDLEGTYKVALLKAGDIVREVTVKALPKSVGEEEKPPTGLLDATSLLWLLIIVGIGVFLFLWWRKKGEKKK